MHMAIQILIVVLLVVSIGAVGLLFMVLQNVQKTLETVRGDVDATLRRVESTVDTVHVMLRDEVTPTLQVARETLAHVEVTTRAIADTTLVAREIVHRADAMIDTRRLAAAGSAVAGFVVKKSATAASSLLSGMASGLGAGIKSLFTHKPTTETKETRKALPPPKDGGETAHQARPLARAASRKK